MNERLKELRKKLGLKQRDLAERLGIAVASIGNWECGDRPVPDARIYQICNEFHVRREWLEKGEGEMFEPTPEPISIEAAQEQFVMAVFRRLSDAQKEVVINALKRAIEEDEKERGEKK